MKLPSRNRDLWRYVLFCDIRRIAGFLLWQAIWIGSALAYNHNHQTYPEHRRITSWRLVLLIVIAVGTGVLIFRMWRFFTDRTRCGVIEKSGLSRSYSASSDPGDHGYDFRLNTTLKLRLSNGKAKRLRFEQKNGFHFYYHEGNRVLKLRGLTYPINLDPDATHGCVCAVCGNWSKERLERCPHCRHSIIEQEELLP